MHERLRTRMFAMVSAGAEFQSKDLVEWAAGMSTGLAQEMQKGSCQLPVPSCQFQFSAAEDLCIGFNAD